MLKLVLEPIDSAESRERDSVADSANEEGQETLVSSLCPLVGIVDIHRGHELMDQPRVENMWVSGHVPHTQLFEQVLESHESDIAQFLHFELFAALRVSSKWSNNGMGSSSRSHGQGSWSRTGGGGELCYCRLRRTFVSSSFHTSASKNHKRK
ncbi:hypothetical protein F2Q68_00044039 [Brassica cretica]|uniref:Uncharacterized protein n=1 Tax=Brassica cretica TaxID=69181 RepID=A0A8S9LIN2_BRACR|nr:hypothetical protein F2Q68_00044039 [Brassica cretica]